MDLWKGLRENNFQLNFKQILCFTTLNSNFLNLFAERFIFTLYREDHQISARRIFVL